MLAGALVFVGATVVIALAAAIDQDAVAWAGFALLAVGLLIAGSALSYYLVRPADPRHDDAIDEYLAPHSHIVDALFAAMFGGVLIAATGALVAFAGVIFL